MIGAAPASRACTAGQPDAAATDDRDARARFDARAVAHRADAGHDAAPDQRREVEREVGVDADARGFGKDRLLAERRGAERGQQPDVVGVGGVRHGERVIEPVLAQLGMAAQAVEAGPAGRDPREHDVIAGGDGRDLLADSNTTPAPS